MSTQRVLNNIASLEDLVCLFPGLFEVVEGSGHSLLYFADKSISGRELMVEFNNINMEFTLEPVGLANDDFVELLLCVDFPVDQEHKYVTYGVLKLKNYVDFDDSLCVKFFELSIIFKYQEVVYGMNNDPDVIGVVDRFYDRDVIMRRYTIKNIIND